MTFTIKILLAMKMTALILFIAITQVSAGSYAQKITLSQKNAKLQHVFKEIWKQSGYDFVYDKVLLQKAKPVTFSVKDATLEEALTACFNGQPFTYSIDNKIIVVKQKETSLIQKITELFSAIDVRGKVVDENGEPLQGATVKVKGSTVGTMTDNDGEFVLKGVPDDAIIVIGYLGYKPIELRVRSDMGIIKMELETSKLDEVKISGGYYETTDRLKTGSIAKVTAKDIEKQPVTSPLLALQGRVAGLEITPSSGAPGVAPIIRVRGNNSLRSNASRYGNGNYPLYIIDGIPINSTPIDSWTTSFTAQGYDPLSTINPSTIESIEVLKDGDATAIYGSRGANGVILVTTKKKSQLIGSTIIDISAYQGLGQVSKKLDLLGVEEYLTMRKEAIANEGKSIGISDYDLIYWDTTRNTDWQKLLIGGTANINDVNATVSSGTKNTSFRFSLGYHKETLVFPGNFGYQRGTGQLSLNHQSENQKFSMTLSSIFGVDLNSLFFDSGQMMSNAISLAPNAPNPFLPDGNLNWETRIIGGTLRSTWTNPFSYLKNTQDVNNVNSMNNISLNYQVLPDLSLSMAAGYVNFNGSENVKSPISSAPPETRERDLMGISNKVQSKRVLWILEPKLKYLKHWGHHHLDILAGLTLQNSTGNSSIIRTEKYVSDALLGSLLGAGEVIPISEDSYHYRYNSIYTRAGYNFQGKYLLNLTGRRDGSSRFGPGKKFGNFGSIGVGWIFSNEKVIAEMVPFVSFGKIRASYGLTGSDQIGDYNYLKLYSILGSKYGTSTGVFPSALYNPEFAWEATNKLDFALEMGFVQNRVNFEISWYRNRSSNQLVEAPLPMTTGFSSVLSNFDATVENTGLEILIRGDVVNLDAFKWNFSLNFSLPKNKLLKFDGIEESPYVNIYRVGEPLSIQWLYKFKGVDLQTGLYQIDDKNGDGILNDLDKTLIDVTGTRYYGGINNNFQYKNFNISFLLQFSHQYAPKYMPGLPGIRGYNQPSSVFNERWRRIGDVTTVQKFSIEEGWQIFDRTQRSDYNVTDASFLRLKTVTASWSLPDRWLGKAKSRSAKFFIQGQNLLTLTKYEGLDPETGASLPPLRMITSGLQCQF